MTNMTKIAKKLSNSYVHGLAKAMDAHNFIPIVSNVTSATVESAWKNVGNEIVSAMKIQNESLLKTVNLTNNKLLQTQISKILDTTKLLEAQRSETLASKVAKIHELDKGNS